MVGKRVTIIIDYQTLTKLRALQAKLILATKSNWSFSKTLSIVSSVGLGAKNFDEIMDAVIETAKKRKIENES